MGGRGVGGYICGVMKHSPEAIGGEQTIYGMSNARHEEDADILVWTKAR